MLLKCKHCGREWDYKGEQIYYCSCPRCRANVKLPRKEEVKK